MKKNFYNKFFSFLPNFFLNKKLRNIKLVVSDVDGVLTDNGIYMDDNGNLIRKFNVKDGLGIKLLQEIGIKVVFLSGGTGKNIILRAEQLNILACITEIKDKALALKNLQRSLDFNKDEILYIGDDLNDIPVRKNVGLLISPNDAVEPFKNFSDIVLKCKGGDGAFRELADKLLRARKKYNFFINGFYKKN